MISAIYGCRNKLLYLTPSCLGAVGIDYDYVNFMRPTARLSEKACQFHMCGPIQSACISQSASLQKWQSCQIPASNKRSEAFDHCAFDHWLDARLRYLQCVCYRGTNLRIVPYNLYNTCWIWQNLVHALQYIPRNMHTVFALLCFVVVIHWLIFPYPSGLLH